jgi:hypothetical protein
MEGGAKPIAHAGRLRPSERLILAILSLSVIVVALVAAPPATVFAFLTDPEKILDWMGTEATAQLHSGGLYLVKGVGGRHARVTSP